jgi:hypothetical protein
LIPLRREIAVLAYHLGEMTVSANPGMLRRQFFNRKTSYRKYQVFQVPEGSLKPGRANVILGAHGNRSITSCF